MSRSFSILLVAVALVLSACGKNEPIVPIGGGYYGPQAPMPPGGGYYPPTSPYGGPGPSPYFQPHMPNGYPNQYTPFLPIDNYMRRTPQMQQVWVNIWVNWQGYSQRRGYSPYDFSRFWYEYCPQQFSGTQYQNLYNYFDQNVYNWVDPYQSWGGNYDPSYYWQNYNYMPYYDLDYGYGYCNDYCSY